jgi:nucleoside-diphosphate-sugar epimerase
MSAAAQGADVIVNGLNPPNYHNWADIIPKITTDVLAAAKSSGATVLIPGNVYVYGTQPAPWGSDTAHRPCSRKGTIRAEMEARYQAATEAGEARVILLRGGDFLASMLDQSAMSQVILKKVRKGIVTTLGDPATDHAYAYLPDMARAALGLLEMRKALPAFVDIPFPGHTFSINDLARIIARQTGTNVKIKPFPWVLLRLTSPFWELARELLEMRYLNDHPHSLSGTEIAKLLPDFVPTELETIIAGYLRRQGRLISTQTGRWREAALSVADRGSASGGHSTPAPTTSNSAEGKM